MPGGNIPFRVGELQAEKSQITSNCVRRDAGRFGAISFSEDKRNYLSKPGILNFFLALGTFVTHFPSNKVRTIVNITRLLVRNTLHRTKSMNT